MRIPQTYFSDRRMHLLAGWANHTQADGSNIGGVPPVEYGMLQCLPGNPGSTLFFTRGSTVPGGYADCEFYTSRPILPNTGNMQLSLAFAVDANHAQFAQCLELDTILCLGGWNYNGSLQINNAAGGMIQIAKADGGWIDTGIKVTVAPDVYHELAVQYRFDVSKKTMSVVGVTFNGADFFIAAALQNVPAAQKNWKDGAILQVQLDLTTKAGGFSVRVDDAQYDWW